MINGIKQCKKQHMTDTTNQTS